MDAVWACFFSAVSAKRGGQGAEPGRWETGGDARPAFDDPAAGGHRRHVAAVLSAYAAGGKFHHHCGEIYGNG